MFYAKILIEILLEAQSAFFAMTKDHFNWILAWINLNQDLTVQNIIFVDIRHSAVQPNLISEFHPQY